MESITFYEDGRKLMGQRKWEDAIDLFQKSCQIDPHFKTLELMGECFMKLGRFKEAIIPLSAASTLNRGPRAPSLLAEAFLNLKDLHAAKEMATLALSRDANNKKSLSILQLVGEGA